MGITTTFMPRSAARPRTCCRPPVRQAEPLFEAILARQCTRSDFDGRSVPAADPAAFKAAALVEGAEVMLITDPARSAPVPELILTANAAQVSDPALAAEQKS